MDDLNLDDLVIRVDWSAPARLRLDWLGCSDRANPGEALGPFFSQALAEAHRVARPIEMHFERLEYFNSATIATLVQLIHRAGKANVALCIHYSPQLKWQALSFEALERAVRSFGIGGRGPAVEFLSAEPPPGPPPPLTEPVSPTS